MLIGILGVATAAMAAGAWVCLREGERKLALFAATLATAGAAAGALHLWG